MFFILKRIYTHHKHTGLGSGIIFWSLHQTEQQDENYCLHYSSDWVLLLQGDESYQLQRTVLNKALKSSQEPNHNVTAEPKPNSSATG